MTRWLMIAAVGLGSVLAWAVPARAQQDEPKQPARRPNVVFIIADDLGYRDIGAFGQDKIRTPNLDRLAAEGMRLTAHYSGNTVCAPSRSVLLSGLHPGHTFIRDNHQAPGYEYVTMEGQRPVPAGHLKFALTMQKLGYATGGFGKWGLGPWNSTGNPNQQGFDEFFGYICQYVAHNYYPSYLWDNGQQVMLKNPEPDRKPRLAEGADANDPASYAVFKQGTQYAPDVIAEQALSFVRENKDKPFFLYYPTVVPHLGYQVPEDSLKEYEGKFPEEPFPGSGQYIPDRTPRATYAAMITRMDREIGRLVTLIEELGLGGETIFVFTSDNGAPGGIPTSYFNSNGIFRGGKGSIYEAAFRVPTIVRWTGRVPAGSVSDRVTGFEDWMPTLLELIGEKAATPKTDGISFAATLRGESQPPREFLYREFPQRGGAQFVRAGEWKLIRHLGGAKAKTREFVGGGPAGHPAGALDPEPKPEDETGETGQYELFNLAADPSEQHDVAAEHPEIVAKLAEVIQREHTPSKHFRLSIDKKRN